MNFCIKKLSNWKIFQSTGISKVRGVSFEFSSCEHLLTKTRLRKSRNNRQLDYLTNASLFLEVDKCLGVDYVYRGSIVKQFFSLKPISCCNFLNVNSDNLASVKNLFGMVKT